MSICVKTHPRSFVNQYGKLLTPLPGLPLFFESHSIIGETIFMIDNLFMRQLQPPSFFNPRCCFATSLDIGQKTYMFNS